MHHGTGAGVFAFDNAMGSTYGHVGFRVVLIHYELIKLKINYHLFRFIHRILIPILRDKYMNSKVRKVDFEILIFLYEYKFFSIIYSILKNMGIKLCIMVCQFWLALVQSW